jgi:uncharacterized protein
VQILLKAGTDVNLTDNSRSTALMWASHQGEIEIISFLLQVPDIQLNLKNHGGYTALMLAQSNAHLEVIELLIKAGAKK